MLSQRSDRFRNLFGPADDLNDPLWNARLCPAVCAFFFLLAETAFRTGNAHPIVLAMGWVQLLNMSIAMFKARDIVTSGSGDGILRPVWALRILPLLCATSILGSEFVHVYAVRSALLGFSCAILLTVLIVGFSTTEVLLRESQMRGEIQQLHLTR